MGYERKTHDVWEIHGNYGHGVEYICTAENRSDAKRLLREYDKNEQGISHKIIKKRVHNNPAKSRGFKKGESTMTISMNMDKETKNTIRFTEILKSKDDEAKVGTIYVPKATLEAIGWKDGKALKLTVTAAK